MDGRYSKHFSEKSLWEKIKTYSKDAGVKVVYVALLLFYVMKDDAVAIRSKLTIAAALGYFILPTDAIFDLTPLLGYSDDLGVLLFALSQVSKSITPEIRLKARTKLEQWFGDFDASEIKEIENQTN